MLVMLILPGVTAYAVTFIPAILGHPGDALVGQMQGTGPGRSL